MNAKTIGRPCSHCAQEGEWAPPDTALGVFLRAVCGFGLLYELRQRTAPDPDENGE
ncbi:hypothetical protein [Kitasatospora cineracea]|uniref:hypothetical protein n=1 Tax=Kitasatospora cineracea TaxID=88074 RepID=UPI003692D46F